MLNTKEETLKFIQKQPTQGEVSLEVQAQNKEIKRLHNISVEYGEEIKRIPYKYKQQDGYFKDASQWTAKERALQQEKNKKQKQLKDEIEVREEIISILKQYKPIEYIQQKIDFKSLKEQLEKYI